jgi:hypothetical protein
MIMSESWTTARIQNLTSAGVIAVLAGFACLYAAKWELAPLVSPPTNNTGGLGPRCRFGVPFGGFQAAHRLDSSFGESRCTSMRSRR